MYSLLWGALGGAVFGAIAELALAWPAFDASVMAKVVGLSMAKGMLIGWLTPRTIPYLTVALVIGALLGGFFWALMAVPGLRPVGTVHAANIVPGALLGIILILRSRPQARRARQIAEANYPSNEPFSAARR